MSIELEQLAKLVEAAEHDAYLDDRCDYLDTITEHLDALKAILARMQALEKVAVAARRYRHSEKIAEQAMANCSAVIVFPPDLAVILDDALAAIHKP